MTATTETKLSVFEALTVLIERKGESNKMVTLGQISGYLRVEANTPLTHLQIKSCLDAYIKVGYVRYYNPVAKLRFFGISKKGWEKWSARNSVDAQVEVQQSIESVDEPVYVKTDEKQCPICGRILKKQGYARHFASCERKHIESLVYPLSVTA